MRMFARQRLTLSPRRSILLVCKANICRSPMAEAVLRRFLAYRGITADVDSAGTHDYGIGLPPYPLAVAIGKRRGYNLSRLVGRQVRAHDFFYFDLLVAMDRKVQKQLCAMASGETHQKIRLLMDFNRTRLERDVPDPYGKGPAVFDDVLDRIEAGCKGLAAAIHVSSGAAVERADDAGAIVAAAA